MFKPLLGVLLVASGLVLGGATPAFACSCRADVAVADALAESDGAFVGTLTGTDDPLAAGPLVSSGRPVVNHFLVERAVKGEIGERIEVKAAASGVSCGLELSVGERSGLLLREDDAGGWTSSLCSQVGPEELLAFAPAGGGTGAGGDPGPDWGFILFVGVLVLAVPLAIVVGGARRRSA